MFLQLLEICPTTWLPVLNSLPVKTVETPGPARQPTDESHQVPQSTHHHPVVAAGRGQRVCIPSSVDLEAEVFLF